MCVFLIITVIYKGELLSHDTNPHYAKPAELSCLLTHSPEREHISTLVFSYPPPLPTFLTNPKPSETILLEKQSPKATPLT